MLLTRKNQHSDESDERDDLAEINMVPMIDIMLVLLIIFMVAAPLSISGIHVQLPQSASKGSPVMESKIILTIDSEGEFYVEKQKINQHELPKKIEAIFEGRQDRSLYIRADQKVPYRQVVYAMSSAKIAGIHKLAMLTTPVATQSPK